MNYAQISLHVFERNREDGSQRRYEFRLLERDGAGASLPFDIEGGVVMESGSNSHDLSATIKATKVQFQIKTTSALAEKLRTADPRQYRLTIRELESGDDVFAGYVKPDFPRYDIFKAAQSVQVTATGELGTLDAFPASEDYKTLYDVFHQINTEVELTRGTDIYMRTRYSGMPLSDPIPTRIWMTEQGKLGGQEGSREQAVRQIAQEFNFQIFQHKGRLVVADTYERLRNPEIARKYADGTGNAMENLLISLDETNIVRRVDNADRGPTGRRNERVGRIVMQRELPERQEGGLISTGGLPRVIETFEEYEDNGVVVEGDVVRVLELNGTVEVSEFFDPQGATLIDLDFSMLQFYFESEVDGQTYYYNFGSREWTTEEDFGHKRIQMAPGAEPEDPPFSRAQWSFDNIELGELPGGHWGELKVRVINDFEVIRPNGLQITTEDIILTLMEFQLRITHNDRPEQLYKQWIGTNAPGQTRVFPIYESDVDGYSGDTGAMMLGANGNDFANSQWWDEGTNEHVSFLELIGRRKAWMMLGAADRVHLIVRDSTPVSLLNVIDFDGGRYSPVAIRHHLFSGYQEIWMLPAPMHEFSELSRYTFDPEDLPAAEGGSFGRGWVTNRIIDAVNSNLAAGAIARLTQDASGLVTSLEFDRQDLLEEGQEFTVINPFSLDRYKFVTAEDQDGFFVFVEPLGLEHILPAGSYVFGDAGALAGGVLQTQYATRIFYEMSGIGVLREDVSGVFGPENPLPLHMFVQAREGWNVMLVDDENQQEYNISLAGEEGDVYQGTVDVPISPGQFIQAEEGSRIVLSGVQLSAFLHVDPGAVRAGADRTWGGESIGTIAEDLEGTITQVPLEDIDEIVDLADEQIVRIWNREGESENVTIDGDQVLMPGSGVVTIIEKELEYEYVAGLSWMKEASYKQSARLNIESARIDATVENVNEQGMAIAGLVLDVEDVENAQATLFVRVGDAEGDIGNLTTAQLNLQADLDSAEATLSATIQDLDTLETTTAQLQLQVGNIDDDLSDLYSDVYGTGGIESRIGTIGARAALSTDHNGNIAVLELLSGNEGSFAGLNADYVLLNNWELNRSTGVMRSTTQINGNDAIILNGTTGFAEFENVKVRGTLTTVVLETEMEVQGNIYLPGQSNWDVRLSGSAGLSMKAGASGKLPGTSSRVLSWVNPSDVNEVWGSMQVWQFGSIIRPTIEITLLNDLSEFVLSAPGGSLVFDPAAGTISGTFLRWQQGTSSVVMSTNNTTFNNPDGNIIFNNMPTFNPGANIVHTRTGSQVGSGTKVLCLG